MTNISATVLQIILALGWNWATRLGQTHNDHQVGPEHAEREDRRRERKQQIQRDQQIQYAVRSL